jgi:hypothetical protein
VKPASLNPRIILLALLIAAIPFVFLWDFMLFRKVFYFFDIEIQWIPLHQFTRNALLEGQSILWNPYVMLGFPQHAESQVGNFYPLNLLLHWLPRQEYAFALSVYIHLALAFGSAYCLARSCRLNTVPAVHAALCFAFSGFMFAQLTNYNIVLVAAYLPLKLLLITWYFQRSNPKYLLYFALLLGIELLICHANLTFITTLGASVYFLGLTLLRKQFIARDFSLFTVCVLIGALLAAIQLLPTYELMNQSWRAGGLSYETATSYSLSFTQYLTAFFPMMYGVTTIGFSGDAFFEEAYFYVGIFGIVLGLFGAWHLLQKRDNRYIAVIALVGLTGFILSLGLNSPVDIYRLLIHVPGFSFFRCPGRWSVLLALGIAMLSGYGLQVLTELLKTGKRWRAVLTIVGITLLVPPVMYWMSMGETVAPHVADSTVVLQKILTPLNPYIDHMQADERFMYGIVTRISPLVYLLCMILALLAVIAASAGGMPARHCALAITLITFLDLLFVLRPAHPRETPDFFTTRSTGWHIDFLQQHAGVFRVTSPDTMPNMLSVNNSSGSYHGIQSPKGYASINLRNYNALQAMLYQPMPEILDYVGVKYEIVQHAQGTQGIEQRPGVFPRAFLLDKYAVTETDDAAFIHFLALSPGNRKAYALVSTATADLLGLPRISEIVETGMTEVQAVAITDYQHSSIKLEGRNKQPAFLILTDMHYPGWHAKLNGREVPIVPLQGVFRGVWLGQPGTFTVEMVYTPLSFRLGATCSVLAIILLGTGFWFARRRWPRGYLQETFEARRHRIPRQPIQIYKSRG